MPRALPLVVALVLAASVPQYTDGKVPPVSEFCALKECPEPKWDVVGHVNGLLAKTFGPENNGAQAQCGDGICDISRNETCASCPQDCGPCDHLEPVTQCINRKHVALTFDDGPSPWTARVLDILKEKGVKATFFVNGVYLVGKEHLTKRAYDEGHIIGSHTYSHRSLSTGKGADVPTNHKFTHMDPTHMHGELAVNDALIHSVIGKLPRFVRPPFLETSPESLAFLFTAGYTAVNTNLDTHDWQVSTADHVVHNVQHAVDQAPPSGWIVLQHDSLKHSVDALPHIIDSLAGRGVQFVSMDQCVGQPAYRAQSQSPFLAPTLKHNVLPTAVSVAHYADPVTKPAAACPSCPQTAPHASNQGTGTGGGGDTAAAANATRPMADAATESTSGSPALGAGGNTDGGVNASAVANDPSSATTAAGDGEENVASSAPREQPIDDKFMSSALVNVPSSSAHVVLSVLCVLVMMLVA